jgi:hypothetical protein
MNVGEFSAAELVDFATIAFDPSQVVQIILVVDGNNGDVAGAGPIRIRADA